MELGEDADGQMVLGVMDGLRDRAIHDLELSGEGADTAIILPFLVELIHAGVHRDEVGLFEALDGATCFGAKRADGRYAGVRDREVGAGVACVEVCGSEGSGEHWRFDGEDGGIVAYRDGELIQSVGGLSGQSLMRAVLNGAVGA